MVQLNCQPIDASQEWEIGKHPPSSLQDVTNPASSKLAEMPVHCTSTFDVFCVEFWLIVVAMR